MPHPPVPPVRPGPAAVPAPPAPAEPPAPGSASIERLTPTRRRELTRRTLLEAAAVVFSREGFHGASLDEVAAAAGFTKGAVYSNFKSKEDLFLALLEDHLEDTLAAAEAARQADAARDDDPLANIRDVMSYPRWWDRS